MIIGVTNDHRGFKLKQKVVKYLDDEGYSVIDYGAMSEDAVDFPDYAEKLGDAVLGKQVDLGIAICGTGIGMSIALNKMRGIYCAKVSTESEAMLSKAHNNANVMAISEDLEDKAYSIIKKFLETPFSNIDRYVRRNEKIRDIENA